jgi:hypothetical protein
MRKLVLWSLLPCLAVCCAMAALWPQASSAAAGHESVDGIWMAGPGCGGRFEWYAHPAAFPYFCDGSAVVQKARWQHWGQSTATAAATFNEAVLTAHNSVGTAPRRSSAVTIVASHVELCRGRRVYRSVVIRYDRPQPGPSTLPVASYLPAGC